MNMQSIMKKMAKLRTANPSMGAGGRGTAAPGRSFAQPMPGGTPGATNPGPSVRSKTTSQGKGVVPARAKTPVKTKQKNPKGKRSVKSNPVGYKNAKVPTRKGGTGMSSVSKKRGGYGATRPNLGFAAAGSPIRPIGGKGK